MWKCSYCHSAYPALAEVHWAETKPALKARAPHVSTSETPRTYSSQSASDGPVTGARSPQWQLSTRDITLSCAVGGEAGVCCGVTKPEVTACVFIQTPAGHSISVRSRCFNLAFYHSLSYGLSLLIPLFGIIPSFYPHLKALWLDLRKQWRNTVFRREKYVN